MLKYKLKILLSKEYMRRIIIIENSGKVNFGGGQKITLQVAEILSKTCELVFVDFAKGTRFEQMINEKFPDSSKILLKGRSFFSLLSI